MSYKKPELVVLGNSINLTQGVCKNNSFNDAVIRPNSEASSGAYEADE